MQSAILRHGVEKRIDSAFARPEGEKASGLSAYLECSIRCMGLPAVIFRLSPFPSEARDRAGLFAIDPQPASNPWNGRNIGK
jgi:hypothetical protein